jgi:hypothetical protein
LKTFWFLGELNKARTESAGIQQLSGQNLQASPRTEFAEDAMQQQHAMQQQCSSSSSFQQRQNRAAAAAAFSSSTPQHAMQQQLFR